MQYSPKLKAAMEQIKNIIEENDIAGMVILHSPGSIEHLLALQPSYSAVQMKDNIIGVETALDKYTDQKEWQEKMSNTSGMLYMVSQVASKQTISLLALSENLDKTLGATHNGIGNGSTHQEQNN